MMKTIWELLQSVSNALLQNWVSRSIGVVIGYLSKTPLTLNWIKGSIQMLWNLLKPSGIIGVLTAFGAFVLALGAVSAWIRDDAVRDTNAAWELKLTKAAQELHNKVGERNLKIQALEQKLVEVDQALAAAVDLNRKVVEKQRASVPLSEACNACRVPNERLWMRKPARLGVADVDSDGGQSPAGIQGDQAPPEKAALPGPGEKGLHGPRAGIGSGLLGGLRNGN